MTAREPALHGFEVTGFRFAVAVDGMIDHFLQRGGHGWGTAEVHVGDPHRQHVFWLAAFFGKVIFERAGTGSVDDFIEVVRGKTAGARARRWGIDVHCLRQVGDQVTGVFKSD